MRRNRLILLLCLASALIGPAVGSAATRTRVVADCYAHNALEHHYSIAQLRGALATMPADIREYTSCYQIIQDQLFRQIGRPIPGGSSGASASDGSFVSTPLLIVIILIVLGGVGAAYAASRRRPPPAS